MPYAGIFSIFISALRFLFFFVLGIVLKPIFLNNNRSWLEEFGIGKYFTIITAVYILIGFINPTARFYNLRYFYGVAVTFYLFYEYTKINGLVKRFFEKLGKNTFYIYLFHFLPMYFCFYFLNIIPKTPSNPIWLVIGFTLVGLTTSWIFTASINKIKTLIN